MEPAEAQREFLQAIFRGEQGVVRFATRTSKMEFRNALFSYPEQLSNAVDWIQQEVNAQHEVYFSPDLFVPEAIQEGKATKDFVRGSHVIPVDFDGNAPQDESEYQRRGLPVPSIVVQSSDEYHKHVYWVFHEFVTDIAKLEAHRRIFTGKTDGDNSGWDAGGLFRVPETTNWGYGKVGRQPQQVFIEEKDYGKKLSFASLPEPSKREVQRVVFEQLKRELDSTEPPKLVDILADHSFSDDFKTVFKMDASETADRSRSLVRLAHGCVESGLTDLETYVVLEHTDSRWKKYTQRSKNDRIKLLSDCIERARIQQSSPEIKFKGIDDAETEIAPQTVFNLREVVDYKIQIEWFFKGLLSTTGYGLLTGPPGVGKTQMMLRVAELITRGESLYGWHNEQERKGRVLLFSMEMDIGQLQYFIHQMNMPVEEIWERYHIYHGQDMMPLDDKHGQAAFEFEINRTRPDVVFIDSLSKMIKRSPSDDEAVRTVQAFLSRMRKKYHCAMVVLHHTKKREAGRRALFDLTDIHGSVFITSEADMVLIMEPIGEHIVLNLAKVRLSKMVRPTILWRNEEIGFDIAENKVLDFDRGVTVIDSATTQLDTAIRFGDGDATKNAEGF